MYGLSCRRHWIRPPPPPSVAAIVVIVFLFLLFFFFFEGAHTCEVIPLTVTPSSSYRRLLLLLLLRICFPDQRSSSNDRLLRRSLPDATWTSPLWKRTPDDVMRSSFRLSSRQTLYIGERSSTNLLSCISRARSTRILGGRKIKRGICLFLDTHLDAIFRQTRLTSLISQSCRETSQGQSSSRFVKVMNLEASRFGAFCKQL